MKTLLARQLFAGVLFALLIGLISTQSVSAQAVPHGVLCGDLAAADCALLEKAQISMSELTSGSSDFRFDLHLSDIPNLPLDDMRISLGGNYTFVTDPKTLATLHEFQSMDPTALSQDREALLRFIEATIQGVDSINKLYVTLPSELADLIALYTGLPAVTDMALNLRIVDGILYVQLDDFAQFAPELAGVNSWVGFDLLALVDLTTVSAEGVGVSLTDLIAMQSAVRTPGLGIAGPVLASDASSELGAIVDVRRLRDSRLDEGNVAVFAYEFDVASFISSPFVQALAADLLQSSGALQGATLTADDLAAAGFALQMFAPLIFDGLEQDITSAIGLEDDRVYDFHAYVGWDMRSAAKLLEGFSQQMETPIVSASAPSIEFQFVRQNRHLNDIHKVARPGGAFVLPMPLILEFMDQIQAQREWWFSQPIRIASVAG